MQLKSSCTVLNYKGKKHVILIVYAAYTIELSWRWSLFQYFLALKVTDYHYKRTIEQNRNKDICQSTFGTRKGLHVSQEGGYHLPVLKYTLTDRFG